MAAKTTDSLHSHGIDLGRMSALGAELWATAASVSEKSPAVMAGEEAALAIPPLFIHDSSKAHMQNKPAPSQAHRQPDKGAGQLWGTSSMTAQELPRQHTKPSTTQAVAQQRFKSTIHTAHTAQ